MIRGKCATIVRVVATGSPEARRKGLDDRVEISYVVKQRRIQGEARERAHPRLCKFFNVQTIFKHVSMCLRNLLGACIDASAAVQRLCPLCHVHV